MKKKLSILSLLLLFTMTAMAQTLVDGICYNLNGSDNTAEVTKKPDGTKYSGDIVIPASISVDGVDYSVTAIGDDAFYNCSGLTSIEIPTSVTTIGESAFEFCYGLMNIEIPNSVTSIGDDAFTFCYGLTNIEIPNSVTTIGDWTFNFCSGLTSIEIPNSVTSIGEGAFASCSGLTSIEIPNSVTSIGDEAFILCSGLTNIVVAADNPVYDSRENCNAIIETATNRLMSGCNTTIIPKSVTSIGNGTFEGCSGLTSIEIPNSVTSIGDWAFEGCSGLTSITMQRATPPTVGNYLFDRCSKLETIYVPVGASEAYNRKPWNKYNIVEGEVTGIESVETAPAAAKTIYSLDGRVLNRLVKGINIVNGKKVLVK